MAVLKQRPPTSFCRLFALLGLAGVALGGLIFAASRLHAAPRVADKQAVYAAFVVNITRFIQWPDTVFSSLDAPLVIGTFSHEAINLELDAAVHGEKVGLRTLQTLRIQNLDDLGKCHVIYLSSGHPDRQSILSRIAGKPILTISDGDGFLSLGGHVQFVPRSHHIALRIGVSNLRASGLQARAQLLRLAETDEP